MPCYSIRPTTITYEVHSCGLTRGFHFERRHRDISRGRTRDIYIFYFDLNYTPEMRTHHRLMCFNLYKSPCGYLVLASMTSLGPPAPLDLLA
uniref:Uncharacterized protein n=1 Tax=Picea glauca TaxID=3330 RepID=A0A117NHW3_PICGL|nr:hypothetical protein ABT39_MTgene4271 [Picea glauca]QHR90538.1 hypothetical protein Q903MT_gene4563 [Picea sitchensis]